MKTLLFTAAAVAALLNSPLAHADGDDDPGYSVDGQQPGLQDYPPACGEVLFACALRRDPGSGAWIRPAPEPLH